MIDKSGKVYKIKCPNTECLIEINKLDIEKLLEADGYEKFKRLLLNFDVANSRDKTFCPYPGCEAVVIKTNKH